MCRQSGAFVTFCFVPCINVTFTTTIVKLLKGMNMFIIFVAIQVLYWHAEDLLM